MPKRNPFYLREIPLNSPFCDREKDMREIVSHAQSLANVVLYSPRRFGKTSLMKRAQHELANDGAVTIYSHFYGVSSVDDVAGRLTKAIFKVTYEKKSLFDKAIRAIRSFRPVIVMTPDEEKGFSVGVQMAQTGASGFDLLEDVMESLGEFIKESGSLVHITLDEFQEITELPGALKIEGIMREQIQQQQAAYTFVGSRRRVLLAIFNEKQRPFFQSAINYKLGPLPREEFAEFIAALFEFGGKRCDIQTAGNLVDRVQCFPYYAQKLAYFVFMDAARKVKEEDLKRGFRLLLDGESSAFEGILMGLAPQQIALLKAVAEEPSPSIYSQDYMRRHRLGSIGGTQGAARKLSLLDLIEQDRKKGWQVVDPVFGEWLTRSYGFVH
jgi:hypothetical protein